MRNRTYELKRKSRYLRQVCPWDDKTVCDGVCVIDGCAGGMPVWVCPHLPAG